jgi:hypothetical protein
MDTLKNSSIKQKLLNLSNLIREEQHRLLIEAASFETLPNKNLLRQIAELELNISAIDNTLTELEDE